MIKNWPEVATFSIIGFDPETKEWGVAVQSKFLGVGAVVPWAEACVGAVATQSFANTAFGPEGLALLKKGLAPEKIIEELIKEDPDRELRQFAVMNSKGETAAYTGENCYHWAGHQAGTYCTAQGNILVSEDTVQQLVKTFESASGSLAERLVEALDKAQAAGGDSRGKQSAALFIVQDKGGYGGYNDRKYDLRVDDHKEPIKELRRLYELHKLYFSQPAEEDLLQLEGDVLKEVQQLLASNGLLERAEDTYTDHVKKQLKTYYMQENFEERWRDDHLIDPQIITYMKETADQKETL
ncbi:DUF1028 domain-containing protein [Salipaludibacillus aurantiacus]|uniref:Uncharacterized conserved protein, Ntn-hydrolase superfamily n=1 Tax=Salipaludibacillus aurantiacus TaxID=1601833 RepID=A0A1H9RXE1_9BACI|nr:DUF1028 domain-containing protein [Salipaludibacillus aurantiacus]SER76569.1 Uncharacterized conserved protein, Ntn-hydrolase superfamily [Salipaludibacillus aurantiacus]